MIRCLVPTCRRVGCYRRLCTVHYPRARGMVKRGEATWEQLEAEGLAVPVLTPVEKRRKLWLMVNRKEPRPAEVV